MKKVFAKMKEGDFEFTEDFDVPDGSDAKTHIEKVLSSFNESRGCKRQLISIDKEVAKSDAYTWREIMADAGRFIHYCERQEANAYGNRGVKEYYRKIIASFKKFSTGRFGDFVYYVNLVGRDAYDDLTLLKELTIEKYKQERKKKTG